MQPPLRRSRPARETGHHKSSWPVVDADNVQVGWTWWEGGSHTGAQLVAAMDGRLLVTAGERVQRIGEAMTLAATALGAPPLPLPIEHTTRPEPKRRSTPARGAPAVQGRPVRARRVLVRPDAPVVPRTVGVRRRPVEVGLRDDERVWLQGEADRETGGNLAELIRRRALAGMPE